ncbi:MAG: type VI secretion system tube protein Hcp [Tepidisphaeraceae bacterium]|jgi:type VI secretion system secreted protein Hcp
MASDIFLKLDGIDGESGDGKHTGWIELNTFGHSVSHQSEGKISAASTLSAGRSELSDISVTKDLDKASPNLAKFCLNGKVIKSGQIDFCAGTGEKHVYLTYKLTNVHLKTHGINHGGGTARPSETLSFGYTKIEMEYTSWGADGSKGGATPYRWDLTKNAES